MKKMLEIKVNESYEFFDYLVFTSYFDSLISNKYEEKKDKNIDKKEFINKCKDYLIRPIADNAAKYGILYLFLMVREIIFDISLPLLEKNQDKKIQTIKKLFEDFIKENFDKFLKETNLDNYEE